MVLIVIIIVVIRKISSGGGRSALSGHSVRRFFQYVILYGLMVVSALGLSGLLGRLLDRATLVAADQTDLARNVSFVVVGIPLYIFLGLWTRRRMLVDPTEVKSFGWGFYLTLGSLTSLSIAMFALHDILSWAVGNQSYRGPAVARFIVWIAIWGAHWWLSIRQTPQKNSRAHYLVGSLIGLGTVVVGLSGLLAAVIDRVLHMGANTLALGSSNSITKSAITLAVGIPVWFIYWIRTFAKSERDPLWLAYVLLFGVGGGLVMAISFASAVLYTVLVWFLGEPTALEASIHFRRVPSLAAFTVVGIIVWWYHQAVLANETTRTEVRRIYEYLMAGIALLAAAAGLTMVLIAFFESITGGAVIVGGSGARNTLLAAATLLIVGVPVWWIYWRKIQLALKKSPTHELGSPTRRVYLFVLFGIGGLTSVIVLLVGVFFLFDGIFKGNFGVDTLRRARFALAILIATAAVAGYHWMIYRAERELVTVGLRGPRFVLLVGPKDPDLMRAVSHLTGGRVQSWARKDDTSEFPATEEILAIVEKSEAESIILMAGSDGLREIPIDR
ncbi:MAG TPA: DUF5671 domain-containing protein [Candidatus Nanopelagicaceae bacterium]